MKAGELNRRIEIQRQGAPTHDGYNNVDGEWAELCTVWAKFMPGVGKERFANQENAATAPVVFQIRKTLTTSDVNPKDRIVYGGRTYDLVSVQELAMNGLEILAVARGDSD